MASIKKTLWGILGLALLLPPGAFPAPGDSEQSSANNTDQSMQTNQTSKVDSNVGPAQSGPGASGLFTPNSPGNSAALAAQMSGGLAGSPIVDGAGVNLKISVPHPTMSQAPVYERITSGGTAVGGGDSTVGGTGPLGNVTSTSSLMTERQVPRNPGATAVATSRNSGTVHRGLTVNKTITTTSTAKRYSTAGRDRGVTGSIEYQDGDVVLFGDQGVLKTTSKRKVSRAQKTRI